MKNIKYKIILCSILLTLFGCANDLKQHTYLLHEELGGTVTGALSNQITPSIYSTAEEGQLTYKELYQGYTSYTQGKGVQSASGEKLTTITGGGASGGGGISGSSQ